MALLGTFLVRSGVLQSIHAFGDNTVGPYILGLIGVVLIGSTALIVSRLDDLRSPKRIDSLASRESVFLVNNLLLVGMTAVIFWGTFFPLISELFTGEKASLAAPWFDRYTTPLAILLVLFTGIGPLLAWRRVSWESAKRVFRVPLAVAAVVTARAWSLFTDAAEQLWALALFAFAAFALTGLAQEFWTGARPRASSSAARPGPQALVGLVSRNRRRYGGYIVHIGIIVLLIGDRRLLQLPDQPRRRAAAGGEHHHRRPHDHLREADGRGRRREARLRRAAADRRRRQGRRRPASEPPATSARPARKRGRSAASSPARRPARSGCGPVSARTSGSPSSRTSPRSSAGVRDGRQGLQSLRPGRAGHAAAVQSAGGADARRGGNPALQAQALKQITELQSLAAENVARSFLTSDAPSTFKVIVNPLVTWMWIGGLIALAGALIALWPTRGRRRGALVRTEADARKEAKYREIRDAELDHATGKLSDEDFAVLDAELRREALEILDRVERQRRHPASRKSRSA